MIRNNDIVSPYQIAMIIIMTVISVGVFSIAADAADAAGPDGWLAVAVTGVISLLGVLILVSLSSKFPGKTFAEYSQEVLGTIPGKTLTAMFSIYLMLTIAYQIRAFTEAVKMFLLFRTPTEVIMLSLILVGTYVVRGGVECIARINELVFPILFIPFFAILIFGIPTIDFSNLRPMLQTPPGKILSAIPTLAFSFGGIEIVSFYAGFMKDPKKAYKPAIIAVAFVTLFLIMITAFCIAAFGAETTTRFLWPLIALIRRISLPGIFIERLDGVILSIWILAVFVTVVSAYFVITYSISKLAGTKEQKQYVLPLAIIIYYLAMQPDSLAELYEWGDMFFPYAFSFFSYAVPVAMILAAKLRKLEVKQDEAD